MKLLLDTSVIIDFLRRKDKENSLLFNLSREMFYISIVTHTELYSGKSVWEKNEKKQALEDVLDGITVLTLDNKISQTAGKIKAYHHTISFVDAIIAATALDYNIPLVTLNTKDFESIEGLNLFQNSLVRN